MKKRLKIKRMKIYIDGSCRPNSRLGGYAIKVIPDKSEEYWITGTQNDVTNNIMELTALIKALEHIEAEKLDEKYEIEIFSDSQYVILGLSEWWPKWESNDFMNSKNKPVKNLELWKKLHDLSLRVRCKLTWVKGHANDAQHNEVDAAVFKLTSGK